MVRWIPAGNRRRAVRRGPSGGGGGTRLTRALFDARDLTPQAAVPDEEEMRAHAARIAELGYRRYALVVGPARFQISATFARPCSECGTQADVSADIDKAAQWLDLAGAPACPGGA